MKTVEINLYSFEELSDDAKQKAIQEWHSNGSFEFEGDALMNSMTKGVEWFGCTLRNWQMSFSEPHRSEWSIETPYDPFEIVQELDQLMEKLGTFDPKTLKGHGECVLTGWCYDEHFIDGVRIYLSENDGTDVCDDSDAEYFLTEMIESGINSILSIGQKEYEYQFTEEWMQETCDANEYTFEEDGTMRNC